MAGLRGGKSQTVEWSGYWRTQVKSCTRCGNIFPLDRFYRCKGRSSGYAARCKRCVKETVPVNRSVARRAQKKYRARHPEKYRSFSRNAMNKPGYYHRKKIEKVAREMKLGVSDHVRHSRTRIGRLRDMVKHIRKSYGLKIALKDVHRRFYKDIGFRTQYALWKESGYKMAEAPTVWSETRVNKLRELRIVRYGYIRAYITKRAWKNGDYGNRNKGSINTACLDNKHIDNIGG